MHFDTPQQLHDEIRRNYHLLEGWRKLYDALEEEYRGNKSGFSTSKNTERPVNVIQEFVDAALPELTPEKVVPAVSSKRADSVVDADVLNIDLEQQFSEMDLVSVCEDIAHELCFAPISIVEMGRHEGPKTVEVDGERFSLTEAFAKAHRLRDVCVDLDAVRWQDRRFVAVRVQIRRDQAIRDGIFGSDTGAPRAQELAGVPVMTREEAAAELQAHGSNDFGSGDMRSPHGVKENDGPPPFIQLWRVACYEGNSVNIAYIADDDKQPQKWLYYERHVGHPNGPFSCARARWASDSMLGPPLLSAVENVHSACVKLGNKMIRQLMNMKNLAVAKKENRNDAMRMKKAEDSTICLVDDPESIKPVAMGGITREFPAGLQWLQQQFGNQAGNIRQVGGTEGGADTATVASFMQQGGRQRLRRTSLKIKRILDDVTAFVAFALVFDRGAGSVGIPGYRQVEFKTPSGEAIPVIMREGLEADEQCADILRFTFEVESWATQITDPNMLAARFVQFLDAAGRVMPMVQMGVLKPSAPARMARQIFGLPGADAYFNDLDGQRQLVQGLAFANSPVPPMATPGQGIGQGQAPPPQGPMSRTAAVQSAIAPSVPSAPAMLPGASPAGMVG